MGLDVYLYHYTKPLAEVQALRKRGEEVVDKIEKELYTTFGVKDFDGLTQEQHSEYFAKKRERLQAAGFDDYGDAPEGICQKIEIDSKVYPQHMFKVGYLRSSYNEGGINRILDDKLGRRLDDVFPEVEGARDFPTIEGADEYYRPVNWGDALQRARSLKDDFVRKLEELGPYDITTIGWKMFRSPDDLPKEPGEAMDAFQRTLKQHKESAHDDRFSVFSNRDGDFFLGKEGMDVVAVIPGVRSFLRTQEPCFYIVRKLKPEVDEKTGETLPPFQWYVRALEITVEMCEWVLGQPNPEQYILHWSG